MTKKYLNHLFLYNIFYKIVRIFKNKKYNITRIIIL